MTKNDPALPEWAQFVNHPNMGGYAAWIEAHRGKARHLMMDYVYHHAFTDEEKDSFRRILDQLPIPEMPADGRQHDAIAAYESIGLSLKRPHRDCVTYAQQPIQTAPPEPFPCVHGVGVTVAEPSQSLQPSVGLGPSAK